VIGDDGTGLALVAEQVAEFGGMERVVETILARYPAATVTALGLNAPGGFDPGELDARVRQRLNGNGRAGRIRVVGAGRARRYYGYPLYARRIRAAPLDGARTVLSLGGLHWTLAAEPPAGVPHVGYVGGPPRPLYGFWGDYVREYPRAARPALLASIPALRAYHRRLLRRGDRLIANSAYSARRLEPLARRAVGVLHPPARTRFFTPADTERRHFLVVSRLRRHKRIEAVIEAFRTLGEPLVIAGAGPWLDALRADAPANVTFTGHLGDEDLRALYRSSRALISPSVEEFGLCLAEAQAAGVPVVGTRRGGSAEVVLDGRTGVLLDEATPATIAEAVRRLERMDIDPAECRRHAERFSEERFLERLAPALSA
jgi:glycosyltransferase involved in cell wall biosynthesis